MNLRKTYKLGILQIVHTTKKRHRVKVITKFCQHEIMKIQKIVLTDHQKLPLRILKLKETPYVSPQPSKSIQKNRIILMTYTNSTNFISLYVEVYVVRAFSLSLVP